LGPRLRLGGGRLGPAGARPASAPRARGAAAGGLSPARGPPSRFTPLAEPPGPGAVPPCSLSPTSAACGARGPGWARRARRRRSTVTTPPLGGGGRGGACVLLPGLVPPPPGSVGGRVGGEDVGGGRGLPRDDTVGRCRMGRRGDVVSLAQSTDCARCTCLPIVIIPAGINRWRLDKATPTTNCVLSCVTTDAPSVLSLIGCTGPPALPGIPRTRRARLLEWDRWANCRGLPARPSPVGNGGGDPSRTPRGHRWPGGPEPGGPAGRRLLPLVPTLPAPPPPAGRWRVA
jgi:hypothetical protein